MNEYEVWQLTDELTWQVAEEIRQDEQAARVRDYGPQDAATYPARVKEGAEMDFASEAREAARSGGKPNDKTRDR